MDTRKYKHHFTMWLHKLQTECQLHKPQMECQRAHGSLSSDILTDIGKILDPLPGFQDIQKIQPRQFLNCDWLACTQANSSKFYCGCAQERKSIL